MKKELRAAAGLLLVLCAPHAAAIEDWSWKPTLDGEAGIGYDSNVTRAEYKRDIEDDAVAGATLAAVWNAEFGMMSAGTVRLFVEGEAFDRLDTLNRTSGGVQGIYRWQRALGFTAPFYQFSVTAQQDEIDGGLRSGNRYAAQFFITRRVTDEFRMSLGLEGSTFQSEGVVFDVSQGRVFVNGDLGLNENWALYGTYSLIAGDTVSSARQVFCDGTLAGDTYSLIDSATAIETDEALNAVECGSWLSYRLDAMSHVFVVGANRGFGHHLSLDLSAQQVLVNADGGNDYQRTIVRAGILARF